MTGAVMRVRVTNAAARAILVAVVLCGYSSQTAAAQGAAVVTIAPGAEVRVTPSPGTGVRTDGRFVSLTRDTLTFATGPQRSHLAIPTTAVQRLEVRGSRQRTRGAVIGAGILGGIAVVFGGIDASKGSIGTGEYLGTIAGNAVIGALAGAALAPRGWTAVPVR